MIKYNQLFDYPNKEKLMPRYIPTLTILCLFSLLGSGCSKQVSYAKDVYPILEENCLECHKEGGKGQVASGLSMETYEDLMKGTKYGPVIVPGSGFSSTMAILMEHKADPVLNMPHNQQPLAEEEIETIKVWIDQGAKNN